ncbi:MAG: redoxin domain-containing protein [Pseudonocardiaceae bacterium]
MSAELDGDRFTGPPRPQSTAPDLRFPLQGGGFWNLANQDPHSFTMVIFYRGRHCPVCRGQLETVRAHLEQMVRLGVDVVAVSADNEATADRTRDEWDIAGVPLGYDLDLATMRSWGLFVSSSTTREEPEHFSEPALFLVQPDRAIYYAALTSMPFGRPRLDELIGGMEFVLASSYPARGDA